MIALRYPALIGLLMLVASTAAADAVKLSADGQVQVSLTGDRTIAKVTWAEGGTSHPAYLRPAEATAPNPPNQIAFAPDGRLALELLQGKEITFAVEAVKPDSETASVELKLKATGLKNENLAFDLSAAGELLVVIKPLPVLRASAASLRVALNGDTSSPGQCAASTCLFRFSSQKALGVHAADVELKSGPHAVGFQVSRWVVRDVREDASRTVLPVYLPPGTATRTVEVSNPVLRFHALPGVPRLLDCTAFLATQTNVQSCLLLETFEDPARASRLTVVAARTQVEEVLLSGKKVTAALARPDVTFVRPDLSALGALELSFEVKSCHYRLRQITRVISGFPGPVLYAVRTREPSACGLPPGTPRVKGAAGIEFSERVEPLPFGSAQDGGGVERYLMLHLSKVTGVATDTAFELEFVSPEGQLAAVTASLAVEREVDFVSPDRIWFESALVPEGRSAGPAPRSPPKPPGVVNLMERKALEVGRETYLDIDDRLCRMAVEAVSEEHRATKDKKVERRLNCEAGRGLKVVATAPSAKLQLRVRPLGPVKDWLLDEKDPVDASVKTQTLSWPWRSVDVPVTAKAMSAAIDLSKTVLQCGDSVAWGSRTLRAARQKDMEACIIHLFVPSSEKAKNLATALEHHGRQVISIALEHGTADGYEPFTSGSEGSLHPKEIVLDPLASLVGHDVEGGYCLDTPIDLFQRGQIKVANWELVRLTLRHAAPDALLSGYEHSKPHSHFQARTRKLARRTGYYPDLSNDQSAVHAGSNAPLVGSGTNVAANEELGEDRGNGIQGWRHYATFPIGFTLFRLPHSGVGAVSSSEYRNIQAAQFGLGVLHVSEPWRMRENEPWGFLNPQLQVGAITTMQYPLGTEGFAPPGVSLVAGLGLKLPIGNAPSGARTDAGVLAVAWLEHQTFRFGTRANEVNLLERFSFLFGLGLNLGAMGE